MVSSASFKRALSFCLPASTSPVQHLPQLLHTIHLASFKREHTVFIYTPDEGLASPALIYLEVAADEAGFHFIIAFDKIDDEYILYIAVAITILDIEKLNLYTRQNTPNQ